MSNLRNTAVELFKQGYSCSESVVRAAYECKMVNPNVDIEILNQMASPFSGGMSTGCVCGAVAGAQMIIGIVIGRKDMSTSPANVKSAAKQFMDKFKEMRRTACCRALSAGYEFNSPERRQNCACIIEDVADILEAVIREELKAPAIE